MFGKNMLAFITSVGNFQPDCVRVVPYMITALLMVTTLKTANHTSLYSYVTVFGVQLGRLGNRYFISYTQALLHIYFV
jgi:hypothetical protein